MSKYNKLQGTRVLVIGGSSGIGYAVAEAALESGATVYISSSNQTKIDAAVAQLATHALAVGLQPSAAAGGLACDLSNNATTEANLLSLLDAATENNTKKLNHVVYTAGDALSVIPASEITPDAILASYTVRVVGALMLAKHLPAYAAHSNKSSFTLTGGSLGVRPVPGMSLVAGISTATEGYARGLALDLKPIRVNVVQAGAIRTPLLGDSQPLLDMYAKDTVTGTVGRVEEVAEAYLYLMRDSFITAAVIESSGGRNVGQSQEVSEFN